MTGLCLKRITQAAVSRCTGTGGSKNRVAGRDMVKSDLEAESTGFPDRLDSGFRGQRER